MNRVILFGVTTFFALVGVGLVSRPDTARAGHGWLFSGGHAWHGGNRCYGWSSCAGCSGCSSCSGCWGHPGCHGPVVMSRCYGCSGCSGWSGCYGYRSCYGCSGCSGCSGCYGSWMPVEMVPVEVEPAPPATPAPAAPAPTETKSAPAAPQSADLRVRLPEDARLVVGDFVTQAEGSERYYRSPALESGKEYLYELRAEVVRDGRTIEQTKTVHVKAGQTVEVDFSFDQPWVAQASAR